MNVSDRRIQGESLPDSPRRHNPNPRPVVRWFWPENVGQPKHDHWHINCLPAPAETAPEMSEVNAYAAGVKCRRAEKTISSHQRVMSVAENTNTAIMP